MRGKRCNLGPTTELSLYSPGSPEQILRSTVAHTMAVKDQWKELRGSSKWGERLKWMLHKASKQPTLSFHVSKRVSYLTSCRQQRTSALKTPTSNCSNGVEAKQSSSCWVEIPYLNYGLSSSSAYPQDLSGVFTWSLHPSIIHSYEMSRRASTYPIFQKCSKWAIKSTGIKSFLINGTRAQGTPKEMMDFEKRELKRKVSINLKLETVQPSGKWMGLFFGEPDMNPPVHAFVNIKCLLPKFE